MIARCVDRLIRSQRWLEPVGGFVQNMIGEIYKPLGRPGQGIKTFLHGTWLGHALHAVIVDIPLGAWTAGVIADLIAAGGGMKPDIGDFCVLVGVLASYAALITGYTDFHETAGHERNVATAHGLIMTTAILLYTASWLLRALGHGASHGLAVALALAGYVLVVGGAYLGGDLVYKLGTMVNRHAFGVGPTDFVRVGRPQDFAEGRMKKVDAAGTPVLVLRRQGRLYAIANTCSHAGGPLDEGTLRGTRVTCPWHGSQFDITDGRVVQGPATFDQPRFAVRETDDGIEVAVR